MVAVVQWALNAAYFELYQACPFKMAFGRELKTPLVTLLESSEGEPKVERLNPTRVLAELGELVRAHRSSFTRRC